MPEESGVEEIKNLTSQLGFGETAILDITEKNYGMAHISFHTFNEALRARKLLAKEMGGEQGNLHFSSNVNTTNLNHEIVYIDNLPKEISPKAFSNIFAAHIDIPSTGDRHALLYFENEDEMKKAEEALNGSELEGNRIFASKYNPPIENFPTQDYDGIDRQEMFDRVVTGAQFNGEVTPSTSLRFGYVKNTFERELFDAVHLNDARILFDGTIDLTDRHNYADIPSEFRDDYHASLLCSIHFVNTVKELREIGVPVPHYWTGIERFAFSNIFEYLKIIN